MRFWIPPVALALALVATGCGDIAISDNSGATNSDASATYDPGYPSYPDAAAADTGSPFAGADTSSPQEDAGPAEPDASESNEGDKYEYVGTNPFVVVSHDPLSTFAIDVDTASYDIFRRDVGNYSQLPQRESVRLEEYVNYFSYDYPAPEPESAHPFGVHMEAAPNPFAQTHLLRVGVRGEDPPESEAKPAHVVFLIDISGSMGSAEKLPLVKVLLKETLDVLEPGSRVSIVTYSTNVNVALPPTSTLNDKDTILAVIDGLSTGGSTAGYNALQIAYDQAEAGFVQDGINHVLLCTDGDFNVGPSSDQAMVDLIEQERESGVTLGVLGFGIGNLNDSMMEKLSNAGNGTYGVITDADAAIDFAWTRLLSGLNYIAQDVKIQVEFNPAFVFAYRLLGYENRAIADVDFTNDAVDAGEIGAGHQVTALYELVLTDGAIPDAEGAPEPLDGDPLPPGDGEELGQLPASAMAEVRLRYKQVGATAEDPATQVDFPLEAADMLAVDTEPSGDFLWAAAVAALAEVLKESPYATTADLDIVQAIVSEHHGDDPDRLELVTLLQKTRTLLGLD